MAIDSVPSASVLAKKTALLEMQNEWRTIRDPKTGMRRVVMPNLCRSRVYLVAPDGRACSCLAGQNGAVCAHRLAASTVAHRVALEALVSDGWEPIPPHEQRQAEAWQAECRAAPDAARRTAGDEMWPENQDAF